LQASPPTQYSWLKTESPPPRLAYTPPSQSLPNVPFSQTVSRIPKIRRKKNGSPMLYGSKTVDPRTTSFRSST
jgi:hypothetical protein